MPAQRTRLPLALIMSLGLCACSNAGREKEIILTRWIKQDTTLTYTVHVYRWKGEGARVFTEPRTAEMRWSRVELYAVDIEWNDGTPRFSGHRPLLVIHHAVPCPDLLFLPGESTLVFSYLDRDKAKPRTCYEQGDGPGAPNPARRLMAGIPEGGGFGEVAGSLDTSALLAALTGDSARRQDVLLSSEHGQLCLAPGYPCLFPYD